MDLDHVENRTNRRCFVLCRHDDGDRRFAFESVHALERVALAREGPGNVGVGHWDEDMGTVPPLDKHDAAVSELIDHPERLRDGPVEVATTSVSPGIFPSHQVPKAER